MLSIQTFKRDTKVSATKGGYVIDMPLQMRAPGAFPTNKGRKIHENRADLCRGNKRQRLRKGTLAGVKVRREKQRKAAALLEPVQLAGTPLENVYSFVHLGCAIGADGKEIEAVEQRAASGDGIRNVPVHISAHVYRGDVTTTRPRRRLRAGGEQAPLAVAGPHPAHGATALGAADVRLENTGRPAIRRGDINGDVPHMERG